MQPLVSSAQMKLYDETTVSSYETPGLLLMDRAGIAAAHIILDRFPSNKRPVAVVCGKGNNGGDGFVVARVLSEAGRDVFVFLTDPAGRLAGDARRQFEILRAHRNVSVKHVSALRTLKKGSVEVAVDAVFGTGFKGTPKRDSLRSIEWLNTVGAPVVSIDIPSGIDGTSGVAEGAHVRADVTITFGLVKTGLLLNQGREASGRTVCVDIGIPRAVSHGRRTDTYLVQMADVANALPKRPQSLHKYSAGKVLVLAGSTGYTGAAALATRAAMVSGAGAVLLMCPDSVYGILARKLSGEIVVPVPSTTEGTFGSESFEAVSPRLNWADVVLIGPGLSRTEGATKFARDVLSVWDGPAVIDADGLSILSRVRGLTGRLKRSDWILTPHAGEFSALSGIRREIVEKERIEVARTYARENRTTLVLKGAPTCVAGAGGICYVNSTGNPGMATVGTGDVLAGLLAGLKSQGMKSETAAWSAAYLHGKAGDLAAERLGERSLLANDVLDGIPEAMRHAEDAVPE